MRLNNQRASAMADEGASHILTRIDAARIRGMFLAQSLEIEEEALKIATQTSSET